MHKDDPQSSDLSKYSATLDHDEVDYSEYK